MKTSQPTTMTGVLIASALVFSLEAAPTVAADRDPWEVEWPQTLRAAEKEGSVSIYLSSSGDFEKVLQVFQKRYSRIRVSAVVGGLHVATRILAERRAEKYLADVVITGPGTPYYVLYHGKVLDPIRPLLVLSEVADESKWWQGKHHYVDPERHYVLVFIGPVARGRIYYNTNLVKPAEFKSYGDLLRPKWKGRLLMMDPRAPGSARLGLREIYHMPELGSKFIRRLLTEMDLVLTRDSRQAADWVAVGRFPLCLYCSDARYAKAQGLPVDELDTTRWVEIPTVSPGGTSTIVYVNRAPHPNAAKVFTNWLLSREGQITFHRIMNTPDTLFESMREDIPKDSIPPEHRRKKEIPYTMMATPERADHAPIEKLLKELLK